MRRQSNHPPRRTRLIAVIAVLLIATAFASFLLLSSASSTTTSAQQTFTKFKAVSAGQDTLCAIKDAPGTADDGKLQCWGVTTEFNDGVALPTDGGYVSVDSSSSVYRRGCATKSDGSASCWEEAFERQFTPDSQKSYASFAIERSHNCWLLQNGQIGCSYITWGSNATYGAGEVPADIAGFEFSQIVTGDRHSCAIVKDSAPSTTAEEDKGMVKCWGTNRRGSTTPPAGVKFKTIAAGFDHNCGIVDAEGTADHETVRCWGESEDGKSSPPSGTFKSLAAGSYFTCGIKSDDTIACWGNNHNDQSTPPLGRYSLIDASQGSHWGDPGIADYACAIAIDTDPNTTGDQNPGALNCWGGLLIVSPNRLAVPTPVLPTPTPTATPSRDVIMQVRAGNQVTCILTDANEVKCYGRNGRGEADPPDGIRLDNVSVGITHVCGISHYGRFGKRPENTTGYWLPPDSNVVCWGDNRWGQSTPPEGAFATVSAGKYSTCGVKTDGAVACWGINQPPNWDLISGVPTSGEFVDVKIGFGAGWREHACALSKTGQVSCWGNNSQGQTTVPSGISFKAIATGEGTTCGIVQDSDTTNQTADEDVDTMRCWGKGQEHWSDDLLSSIKNFPTDVEFSQIVTKKVSSCGIMKQDYYQNLRTKPLYSVVNRKAGTPYCQGNIDSFDSGTDLSYTTPGNPSYKYRNYFASCTDRSKTFNCPSNQQVTYSDISLSDLHACALRSDGKLVCDGHVSLAWAFGNVSQPPFESIPPTPAASTYTCGSETYNGASPIDGGRFPTTGGNYYVSIPAGALANDTIIGVKMTEGADATFPVQGSGHEFRGKVYSVTVKNSNCTDPSSAITTTRPVDVCIPKPADRAGRWWDWRMYEIIDQSGTLTVSANPAQGFTDLGGSVCAEFTELPVMVAAASKEVPTPTPTATPTPLGGATATPTHTPTPTATPLAVPVIFRIAPTISSVILPAGEKVRLGVDVYGMQNIRDNSLAYEHKITFQWSSSPPGGSFKEADRDADVDSKVDDREVIYTTPREPGIYTLKAFVDRMVCGDDDGLDDGCFAEIEVTVRRSAAPPSPTAIPANPAGEIPSVIVDDDGNQYEVFTPEEGGRFEGDGVSVVAEPGAVPNGEIIGVRADTDGEASNIGRTQDRVTLSGSYYGIYAVDASGQALNGYLLDDPINVCLPVPSRFTSNISQLAMVSERPDSTFATLSSSVRLSTSGVLICGALSEVSARLAVGNLGSPSALPSPTPLPTPIDPDTGGGTIPISAFVLLLILGTTLAVLSLALVRGRASP